MTKRPDNLVEITINSVEQFNNRADIRDFLFNQFSLETPSTKYRYIVETLSNDSQIYIERPGRLNKGCDFVIYIENHILYKNGNDKPPKHDFILDDLRLKKRSLSTNDYSNLIQSINEIFNCQTMATALNHIQNQVVIGESYELVLKLVRWFFIEQDITYWAKSGRQMTYNAIIGI